ncbi:hypothetical protein [Hafnia paralvei]|uniref:hypothetical protein n=1 Tax=Hafnia paralvei TaxID=546367 RepID=UPI000BB53728|nr:hypothetical protein [Hafnia paralvei]MCE9950317.1 hypothetical protein [Hafnia paralvei]NIH30296.1 hypothetical protein [Hafnia paralvei]PNK69330.1 hypothetical protein A6J69_020865 [Hafnia paralvei]
MKITKKIVLLFFVLQFSFCGLAENRIKVTGVYSSFSFDDDSGDVLGTEIIIGYSNEGYWAMFQDSEGEPSYPVIVHVNVCKNKIMFKLPFPLSERGEFNGEIIDNGWLIGSFHTSNQKLKLQLKNSYWQ